MLIKVDDSLVNYIEALQYEKDRTDEIMAFMLSHDYDMTTENFKKWDKENQENFVKYQEAKNQLEKMYIFSNEELKDKRVNWHLDFDEKTLSVEVK